MLFHNFNYITTLYNTTVVDCRKLYPQLILMWFEGVWRCSEMSWYKFLNICTTLPDHTQCSRAWNALFVKSSFKKCLSLDESACFIICLRLMCSHLKTSHLLKKSWIQTGIKMEWVLPWAMLNSSFQIYSNLVHNRWKHDHLGKGHQQSLILKPFLLALTIINLW